MTTIFKGDDTDFLDNNFITIHISNEQHASLSLIEVITNSGCCIPNKKFTDENYFKDYELIELHVNYDSNETNMLNATNTVNVKVYDLKKRGQTCPQTLTFYAKNGVIKK